MLSLAFVRTAEAGDSLPAVQPVAKAPDSQSPTVVPPEQLPPPAAEAAVPDSSYPEDFSAAVAPTPSLEDRYAAFGEDEPEIPLPARLSPETPQGLR